MTDKIAGWRYWWNAGGNVKRIIEEWQPVSCTNEKDCELSLYNELRVRLPESVKIQSQYGSGRQKIDLAVDDKIAIELKYNLTITSAYHRALGQLEDMLKIKNWEHVFLVICGPVNDDIHHGLNQYADKNNSGIYPTALERLIIIKKDMGEGR